MERERVEIEVPGATLAGDRWRGSGPTVVLLHAGVCDRRSWRETGALVAAAGYDVVAYDRRGFGEVPPPAAPFRHVDDLLAVLDAVSPGAPAWLAGSSMGGGAELDDEVVDAEIGGLGSAIDAAWTAGDVETLNRLEVRLWLDGPGAPEGRVRGPARELALEMNRIAIAGESEEDGASGVDAAGRLHELEMPVTVACGELDAPMKLRRCAELARPLPNALHRTLPGRAHLPYLEAP